MVKVCNRRKAWGTGGERTEERIWREEMSGKAEKIYRAGKVWGLGEGKRERGRGESRKDENRNGKRGFLAAVLAAFGIAAIMGRPMEARAEDYEARIGEDYYGSLEEAFGNAQAGDTVVVLKDCSVSGTLAVNADGIVLRSGNAGEPATVRRDEDFAGKDYYLEGTGSVLVGVDGGSLTTQDIILDGGAAWDGEFHNSGQVWDSPLVYVNGTYRMESGTVLQNNDNTDGNGENSAARFAGAVQVMEGGVFDMRGGVIRDCRTNGSGGGVHGRGGSYVSAVSGNIWNCYGMTGGAMAFFGPAEVSGVTMSGNCARTGGAVEIHHEVRLSGCVLENNRAALRGGAVGISGDYPVTIEGCIMAGNSAEAGSAVSISDAGGNTCPVIKDCTFTGNRVTGSRYGAVHYMGRAGMVLDGVIAAGDNTAADGTGCDISFMYADAEPVSLGEGFRSDSLFVLGGSDEIAGGKLLVDASRYGKADAGQFVWGGEDYFTEEWGGDIYLMDMPDRYYIFYDANNGGIDFYEDPGRYTGGEAVKAAEWQAIFSEEMRKEGYVFAGWNTEADGTGTDYREGQEIYLTGNLWLYAKWEPAAREITVTFFYNGGSGGKEKERVVHGSSVILPDAFREGYALRGWFEDEACGILAGAAGGIYVPEEDMALYAGWQEAEAEEGAEPGEGGDGSNGDGDDRGDGGNGSGSDEGGSGGGNGGNEVDGGNGSGDDEGDGGDGSGGNEEDSGNGSGDDEGDSGSGSGGNEVDGGNGNGDDEGAGGNENGDDEGSGGNGNGDDEGTGGNGNGDDEGSGGNGNGVDEGTGGSSGRDNIGGGNKKEEAKAGGKGEDESGGNKGNGSGGSTGSESGDMEGSETENNKGNGNNGAGKKETETEREAVIQTGKFSNGSFYFMLGQASVLLILFCAWAMQGKETGKRNRINRAKAGLGRIPMGVGRAFALCGLSRKERGNVTGSGCRGKGFLLTGTVLFAVSLAGMGISYSREAAEMGRYAEIAEICRGYQSREEGAGNGPDAVRETQEWEEGDGYGREAGLGGWIKVWFVKGQEAVRGKTVPEAPGGAADGSGGRSVIQEQRAGSSMDYDWESLCRVNPDTAGWLCLPGSVVDFPVMAARDDSFYLSHDFTGAESRIGCPFMDRGTDREDFNRVIYGHNMGAGSEAMFSTIINYEDEEYFAENRFLYFADVYGGTDRYEIIAVVKYNVKDIGEWDFRVRNFGCPEERRAWMGQLQERAFRFRQPEEGEGRMITLATCDRREYGKSGRFLLFAVCME